MVRDTADVLPPHAKHRAAAVHHVYLTFSAANIQPYEYWSVVRSAAVFLQQISTLIIFVVRAPRQ